MGILLFSTVISVTVGVILGQLSYKYAERRGRPKLGTIVSNLLGFGVGIPLFLLLFMWAKSAATETQIAMNSCEGEQQLAFLGLPPKNTSDFCYHRSFIGSIRVLADFKMSEADFHAWMNSQNWKVIKFEPGLNEYGTNWVFNGENWGANNLVYPLRQYDSQTAIEVKRGYCYFSVKVPGRPGNHTKIIYDLDSGRAYVESSSG